MVVVGSSGTGNSEDTENTGPDLGGGALTGLTGGLQRLDQGTSRSVRVVGWDILFTLGSLFVETLANFNDIILVLVITLVLLVGVLGLLTGDGVGVDKGGLGIGEFLSVGKFRKSALGCLEGAPFISEKFQEDGLSI